MSINTICFWTISLISTLKKITHFGLPVTWYVGCVVFQQNESGQLINTKLIHLITGSSVWLGYPSLYMLINIPLFTTCHCTMGLSVALRIWKSKGLDFAQFWSNIHQSCSNWSYTTQIFNEKYRHLIFVKNLGDMGKKCEGGSVKVEVFGNEKWDHIQKKPQNNLFHRCPLHCEIQIWKI